MTDTPAINDSALSYLKMAFDDPESGQWFESATTDGTTVTVIYSQHGERGGREMQYDHTHIERVASFLDHIGEDDPDEVFTWIDGTYAIPDDFQSGDLIS